MSCSSVRPVLVQPSAMRRCATEGDAVKPSMTSSASVSLALEGTGARQVIIELIFVTFFGLYCRSQGAITIIKSHIS